ncbi:MAG: hypothetical protein L6Q51_00455 [Cyclobacteriaceae bacterium]|nr:hypothetical protein [Cyclobacteriaceae bacterium]
MIQSLIIGVLFLASVSYLGLLVYRAFQARSCATGCGKCAVLNVDKIAKEIKSRENSLT